MKQRPILFSGAMVRAILEGRKTQTRRVVKAQPEGTVRPHAFDKVLFLVEKWPATGRCFTDFGRCENIKCPYGVPGDRLWVRETWGGFWSPGGEVGRPPDKIIYRADEEPEHKDKIGWGPSIHMPREYSRINLEITGVRVERLQEIGETDADAEGVEVMDGALDEVALCARAKQMGRCATDASVWFAELWDTINAERAPWASNPWVWVLEFKQATQ